MVRGSLLHQPLDSIPAGQAAFECNASSMVSNRIGFGWTVGSGVPGRAWLAGPPAGLRMARRLVGDCVECLMLPRSKCHAQTSVRRQV